MTVKGFQMKNIMFALLLALTCSACATSGLGLQDAYGQAAMAAASRGERPVYPRVGVTADRYSVTVTRLDRDLYRDTVSRRLIETRYCYEYAYSAEAVLTWEGRYGGNSLIFVDSGTKCDVIGLR